MIGHPDRETLEGFLDSRLAEAQNRAVLAHLAKGCRRCQEILEPYATAMFQPGLREPELTPEVDAAYDAAISLAVARVLERKDDLRRQQDLQQTVAQLLQTTELPEDAALGTWDVCHAMLAKSRELRHDDPAGMLRLAMLAQHAADRIESADHEASEIADLRTRAWAELANAWRVHGDLPQAEAAMSRALELQAEGSGTVALRARLADLRASLCCDQRRFAEAFRMLDEAQDLYERQARPHAAGRMLITKGLYTGYMGRPDQALPLLVEGLASIDRKQDPRLAFHAQHNMLLFRVELGELDEARRQIRRMQPLYERHAGPIEWIKLHIIEGKIAAGLGNLDKAEELLLEARRQVDEAGLGYLAALVSLELAAVWLRQGRREEVRPFISELVATFRAIGVEREATAALLLLGKAVERDQSTFELLALISKVLQLWQRGPGLLVRPEPD